MRDQSILNADRNQCVTVLSLSPFQEDHAALHDIVGHSKWLLFQANNFVTADRVFQERDISVVLCERDLRPGSWTDVLSQLNGLRHPPSLIVTSRLADERLWAEALNLGVWDVLAKPFQRTEVLRSIRVAWQHWYDKFQAPMRSMRVMTAAG
jgi:DNA-binding response OmpR family regulator